MSSRLDRQSRSLLRQRSGSTRGAAGRSAVGGGDDGYGERQPSNAGDRPFVMTEPSMRRSFTTSIGGVGAGAVAASGATSAPAEDADALSARPSKPGGRTRSLLEAAGRLDSTLSQIRPRYDDGRLHELNGWLLTAALYCAGTVSLGALSMPTVYAAFGYLPATILIIGVGVLSTYCVWLLMLFYLRHSELEERIFVPGVGFVDRESGHGDQPVFMIKHSSVETYGDAGGAAFGTWGQAIVGWAQFVLLVLYVAASLLVAAQALVAIIRAPSGTSDFCNVISVLLMAAAGLVMSIPRTLRGVGYLSALAVVFITVSILFTVITQFVLGAPPGATHELVASQPRFETQVVAMTNVVFAFSSSLVFFEFIHGMRNPREFWKSLLLSQSFATCVYVFVGITIYSQTGTLSLSPAFLSLQSPTLVAIAYGLSLPNLLIGGVIDANVSSKFVLNKLYRSEERAMRNTFGGWATWLIVIAAVWFTGFLIVEVIPVFNVLLGITSSLFSSAFSYFLPTAFFLNDWWADYKRAKQRQQRATAAAAQYVEKTGQKEGGSDAPIAADGDAQIQKRQQQQQQQHDDDNDNGDGGMACRDASEPQKYNWLEGRLDPTRRRTYTLVGVNVCIFASSFVVVGLGMYSNVADLIRMFNDNLVPAPFAC